MRGAELGLCAPFCVVRSFGGQMLMKTGLAVRLRLLNFALRGVSSMMGSNWHEGAGGPL